MDQTALRGVIIGGTGAVGRELIAHICASNRWSEIAVIARRKLDQWELLPGKDKIRLVEVKSLDELEDATKWQQFAGYNTFFCCLGSRTKEGDAKFIKVDYTYCLWGGQIAKSCNIPHYSIVTSVGSDKNSRFLYMRTKGQIEEALQKLEFSYLSIFRPGAILNRDNDSRCGEFCLKYTPFLSKIESRDLGKALMLEAETVHKGQYLAPHNIIYENKAILVIVQPPKLK